MIDLTELYDCADEYNIEVISIDTRKIESLSMMDEFGDCGIGINPFFLQSDADEKIKLAHELGHCMTGSFYNRYSKLDIRAKHERRADKWAIKKLVPKNELRKAVNSGRGSRYELAEYFNVTEDFMQKALDYYQEG